MYGDFREMLAREDIDAIMTAPPDHWHALIGVEAARRGKDMYYEKPMGLSVGQSKAMRQAINRHGVIFQFGTQQRSEANFRFACELVRNGRIGRLHTIVVAVPPSIEWPTLQPEPIKEEIDYDMWLGPAPWAPYNYERCRPYEDRPGQPWYNNYSLWYHISDYCLGFVANWGVHHLDIAQWGHGTDDTGPVEVEGTGVFSKDGAADTATAWEVEMKYADGVKLIYLDNAHSRSRYSQFPTNNQGILFLGDEGWVVVERAGFINAEPKSILDSRIRPDEIHLVNSLGHHRNFLDSVKTRKAPVSPIETAVRSDTLAQLSDIAMRLGRKLRWDPVKEEFVNDDAANRMLDRPMRSPWHL
jgi:predicted dehydrogenase